MRTTIKDALPGVFQVSRPTQDQTSAVANISQTLPRNRDPDQDFPRKRLELYPRLEPYDKKASEF
jgi:hypothetical protein